MSNYLKHLMVFLMLLSASLSKACSCGYMFPDFLSDLRNVFLNYSATHQNMAELWVTKGIITGITPNGMGVFFKPLRNYYGNPGKDTVIVWGTDGFDCRVNVVGLYKLPADTFICLMNQNVAREYLYESTTDFHISVCGYTILRIKNDSVFGGKPGTFAWDGFPLGPFEDDSLNYWIHALKVEPEKSAAGITLFPNPVASGQALQLRGVFHEDFRIAVCDVSGRVISSFSGQGSGSERNIPIPLHGLSEGTYFLKVESAARRQTLPFTVNNP